MNFDKKDQAALDRAVGQLQETFGDGLRAVSVTGEAASSAYRPARSPLSIAVVLDQVTPDALRRLRPLLKGWRRRRIGTPLLMDPLYIDDSRDVFPLEFLDLGDRHKILYGPKDLFEGATIHTEHLRLEVEEQIKGKLLHLRQVYLEHGGNARGLRDLLLGTLPSFERILRGICALTDNDRPNVPDRLFGIVEAATGISLEAFHRIHRAHVTETALPLSECEDLFDAYVDEVASLASWVNDLA